MSQDTTGSVLRSDSGLYCVFNTKGSIVSTEKALSPIHEEH